MKTLTGRTYRTETNNWYAPSREFSEKHKSVEAMELMDTTSSAGDWEGFLIQKIGKNTMVAIGFYQENNYPHAGFTLYTAEKPFLRGKAGAKFYEDAKSAYYQFWEQ